MIRFPFKKMLVAVDLSDCSSAAWEQAAYLAKRLHSKIEVVFVNAHSPSVLVGDRTISLTKNLEREILRNIRARVGPSIPIHVRKGQPAEEILRIARKTRADLLAMGTHGRSGIRHLGSVAETVAQRSLIPVLIVRRPIPRLKSILVSIDTGDRSERTLKFAAVLAQHLRIPLQAMSVAGASDSKSGSMQLLAGMIRALPADLRRTCRLRPKVLQGNAEKETLREAKRHDLLIIVARREILFMETLLGNTTDRILQFCPVPVLCLPPLAHRRL